MQSEQKIAEENMVRELLFDLSSAEKSVRAGAIHTLVRYASHAGVEAAVRSSYELEQDPYCRQGLEAILDVYNKKSGRIECRLLNRPSSANTATVQPPTNPVFKAAPSRNEPVAVEKKISLVSSTANPEPIKVAVPLPTTSTTAPVKESVSPVSAKEKLLVAVDLLKKKLEWAAQNDVGVSGMGMGIIIFALVCFVSFLTYNMIMSHERFSVSSTAQVAKSAVPGEIQLTEVKSGELIQGTLKEYNLFGQTWAFLSDDNRLFKLKLNQSPGFFKVEERLKITVESCERNSLGHIVLIGTVTP